MKKVSLSILFALTWLFSQAAEFKFGQLCITPYPSQQEDIPASVNDVLLSKMSLILMNNGVAADMSERFIMVPHIILQKIGTTATIPSKTSVNIMLMFAIGDGVISTRYSCYAETLTGVGDDMNTALLSAVRKFKTSGTELTKFVKLGTDGIVDYYDNNTPSLMQQARTSMASGDYESAIVLLAPVPSFCKYFNDVQSILASCGASIISRDNEQYLRQAQSAWTANPNVSGASSAQSYISRIINPSSSVKKKIEALNSEIQKTLLAQELREHELIKLQISTQAEIQKAEIQASASIASAFFSSIPKLVISALRWF